MELKEARYILAIARHQSIGKAAESPLYLPAVPEQVLKEPGRTSRRSAVQPPRKTATTQPTWVNATSTTPNRSLPAAMSGCRNTTISLTASAAVLNIAVPIMMGSTLIEPMLAPFHKRYPYVTLNIMEAVNFIAENSLETSSIDLTLYNIHEFPETMDYQILRSEEIVLVLHENHPLAAKAITRPGFRYPWLDLSLLKEEKLHSPLPGPEHRRHRSGSLSRVQHQSTGLSPHEKLLHVDPSGYGRRRRCLRPGELFPP